MFSLWSFPGITFEHWDFKKLIHSEGSWGRGLMGGINVQVGETRHASCKSRIRVRSSHLQAGRAPVPGAEASGIFGLDTLVPSTLS